MPRAPVESLTLLADAPLPAGSRARLGAVAPQVRVLDGLSARHLAEAEVIYLGKGRFDPVEAPRLRWVQVNSAGVSGFAGSPLAASGVPVASASGAYSTTVAEMAIGLMLVLQRRIGRCIDLQRQHAWRGDSIVLHGLAARGRTMGILGYGSIGREVARLARALGMRVLACKRQPAARHEQSRFALPGTGDPEGAIPEAWFGPDELDRMLRRTDVLVVTLPGTRSTGRLIDAAQLAALPPHAFLINVGRGSVIDEGALVAALKAGRLAGAGLDVFAEEPLPGTHPLWTTPGVVITPHLGSTSVDQPELAAEVLIENIRRDLAGEPLLNLVDFTLGY